MLRLELPVGRAVALPAAFRAHVRRGDAEQVAIGLRGGRFAVHVAGHGFAQFTGVLGVRRPGMRRFAHRLFRELAPALRLHPLECLVFQEPGGAERIHQVLFDVAHFQAAGDPHQRGAEVQVRLAPVETRETLHQYRRNDQHGIAEAVRVAYEQPRMVLRGRRHEVQAVAQTGQWMRQISS